MTSTIFAEQFVDFEGKVGKTTENAGKRFFVASLSRFMRAI